MSVEEDPPSVAAVAAIVPVSEGSVRVIMTVAAAATAIDPTTTILTAEEEEEEDVVTETTATAAAPTPAEEVGRTVVEATTGLIATGAAAATVDSGNLCIWINSRCD